jgi:hypothetical protein
MTLRLNGATSGFTEIDAPAVAGSNTLVLPGGNGSADQALITNGSGTLSFADRGRMVLETAKAYNWNSLTTNTSLDFTSIPSWVKQVTVVFDGVSTTGTSNLILLIGAGAFETTGYISTAGTIEGGSAATSSLTTGLQLGRNNAAAQATHGLFTLVTLGSNAWTGSGSFRESTTRMGFSNGSITLAGTLDRVRITTVGGTNTFDAGTINLLLEG